MHVWIYAAAAILLVLLAGGFYLFAAAKLAGIESATFGKCFAINIALAIVFPLVRFLLGLIFSPGVLLFAITFAINLWILAKFLDANWGKAFLVALIHFILTALTILLFATVTGFGLAAMLGAAV